MKFTASDFRRRIHSATPNAFKEPQRKQAVTLQKSLLLLLLVFQLVTMVYFSVQKEGFHLDEIYSYGLSNSYYIPFLDRTPEFETEWLDGNTFKDYVIVQPDERFAYDSVIYNQEQDVHPPLFYLLLHTICSIFYGTFSKWTGLGLNLFIFLLIELALFKLAKSLTQDLTAAFFTVAMYGFSIGAVDTITYIRMYALLTLWVILFIYAHRWIWESGKNVVGEATWKDTLLLFLLTVLGTLTQYYFLIFAFFFCGCTCLYLLTSKQWKSMLRYGLFEVLGVVFSGLLFPAMWSHLISGNLGKEMIANMKAGEGWNEHLRKFLDICDQDILFGYWKYIKLIAGIALAVYLVKTLLFNVHLSYAAEEKTLKIWTEPVVDGHLNIQFSSPASMVWVMAITCVCYIATIARIAPWQADRYIMCIFPCIAFFAILLLYTILPKRIRTVRVHAFMLALLLLLSARSYQSGKMGYLEIGSTERTEKWRNMQNCRSLLCIRTPGGTCISRMSLWNTQKSFSAIWTIYPHWRMRPRTETYLAGIFCISNLETMKRLSPR